MTSLSSVVGWDIGGVNTKVARIVPTVAAESVDGRAHSILASIRAFEIQRDPAALPAVLEELAATVRVERGDIHAITMTAELSQLFRRKQDGVTFVLDAVVAAFPDSGVHVYTTRGDFLSIEDARREPLAVAASNWAATARAIARMIPDAILVDIGTTTTDIVPVVGGAVRATGWTDPERLATGELLYLGAVRTPVEAITQRVPLGAGDAGVSAESFALVGDVHLWRGTLDASAYNAPTPDGRSTSREAVGERLARVVCADRDMLDDASIDRIAEAVAEAQIVRTAAAITRVRSRHPALTAAVVTGVGDFVAAISCERAGMSVVRLADSIGVDAARGAPAAAVALLLMEEMGRTARRERTEPARAVDSGGAPQARRFCRTGDTGDMRGMQGIPEGRHGPDVPDLHDMPDVRRAPGVLDRNKAGEAPTSAGAIDIVLKVGGSLLRDAVTLDQALAALDHLTTSSRVLVVPGGGALADLVRDVDRAQPIGDDGAHWMAVLAMNQYAELLVSRLARASLVTSIEDAATALAAGRTPILAPYEWLRRVDPLPHSWTVTSDSIAAWVAITCGASDLVLFKPAAGRVDEMTDPYFAQCLAQAQGAPPRVSVCTAASVESVISDCVAPRYAELECVRR